MTMDKQNMYRFPWSLNDNPIAWLEITDICNIYCEGCYRQHMTGHKPLEEIKEEILFFKRWRNPDNVSIAGGEPLIHPDIVEIVRFIAENGIKPIVLTNAKALDEDILLRLKKAGLAGFTIHIDSHQERPHWEGKSEAELNKLRQHYADMIHKVGGLYVIFNATIYPSSYKEIPDIVRWGHTHIDRVHGLVFITYRTAITGSSQALNSAKEQVDLSKLSYTQETFDEEFVTGPEVYQIIKDHFPEYEAVGYLGGTIKHDSFKWTIGAVIGSKNSIFGSVGKKTMELAQIGNHLFAGTYLAYLSQAHIGAKLFLLSLWDGTLRQAAGKWLRRILSHPAEIFSPVYLQSVGIIQAPDMQSDGQADMCDSCPDMTVYNGTLINSCRMDEYRLFGGFVSVIENDKHPASPDEN
jgi:molybdenum cofactor biosynthesis enzyme MoaA